MCGIFGQFGWAQPLANRQALLHAVDALRHRGPDDSGYWENEKAFLGHRRLSIIDLAGGHQPMADDDGRLVVVFNGEIYNYLELRAELTAGGASFRTSSDTEVLLHGWRAWGTAMPSRLIGMFAFALFDCERRTLFMARDRLGEKPFFLMEEPGRLSFASEVKALVGLEGCRRQLEPTSLAAYLCLNYVPGDGTMMAGIRRLPPGNWLLVDADGRRQEEAYWRPTSDGRGAGQGLEEATDLVAAAIDRAVAGALRSDVPVTAFLSGGIDSSIVTESAVRQGNLREAFCVDFAEARFSEWGQAQAVADRLGIGLRRVRLDETALHHLPSLVEHMDDPLADSSALAMWMLSAETARHYKVVLSGDGGDELFGGYLTHQATLMHGRAFTRIPRLLRRGLAAGARLIPTGSGKVTAGYKLRRLLRGLPLSAGAAHFSWNGTWLPAAAARLLGCQSDRPLAHGALDALAVRHRLGARPCLAALQVADMGDYLPNDILVKVDRTTMAHGLEARAPLLTPDLVALALSLDQDNLLRGREGKRVLRHLARRLYGTAIADAPKQGFSIPVHAWLRGIGRPMLIDLLGPDSLEKVPELNAAEVIRVRDHHLAGREQLGFELWGLMVLVLWHRRFIQGA